MDMVTSAIGMNYAQQMGQIQIAVASKMMKVSNAQSQAITQLIEEAAENMQAATENLANSIDVFA